jgi:hypothetical protein
MTEPICKFEFENVIIIPYRNRKEHLEQFIKDVIPLFEKYLNPFKVVVVEQEEGKLFNRGMLLNIGFNEYKDKCNYFFTHDVDTLPNDICVKKLYTITNYDVIRISIPHILSLGNICKFTSKSIVEINGLPNYIWGWGIEDRALYYRYSIMNKTISPDYTHHLLFNRLHHKSNIENYINEKKKISDYENKIFNCNDKDKQYKHIMSSGLNTLEYKIINKEIINETIEILKVSI